MPPVGSPGPPPWIPPVVGIRVIPPIRGIVGIIIVVSSLFPEIDIHNLKNWIDIFCLVYLP